MKIISLAIFICVVCVKGDAGAKDGRQQRLLFYDEDGNLVKTYPNPFPNNPFLQNLRLNAGHWPYYGSFLNPFFGFIKDFGNVFSLTIPVSNEVIKQMQKDPAYHNKLLLTHTPDPIIEPNPLCEGKRAQIPSPKLCNNYLNCWDGWAVEQECPPGLLFSNQGYCDYSDNVNCESRKLHVEMSAKLYKTRSRVVSVTTPYTSDPQLGVCDYPTRVDCTSTAINTEVFAPQSTSIATAAPTTASFASPTPAASTAAPPASVAPSIAPTATFAPPASPIIVAAPPSLLKPDGIKAVFSENSIVNTQSWTSTHIAMSRQDAIRQLQFGNIAKADI
ncbi:hypothetical protein HF086_012513 [Spodoptera exigua]|uniref:Chitin-binding type-2 domain-containing protein n=1 Tax=Spodoptera exigua TaxID=7107 RepID=A0A922N0C5_SPOEX|nr:hypothetical protein HF086_012513 [Spodoptera exigua]